MLRYQAPHRVLHALTALVLSFASLGIQAQPPVERYQSYLDQIAKGTSLVDLTPYMSEKRRDSLAQELSALRSSGADLAEIERNLMTYMKQSTRGPATITPMIIGEDAALTVVRADSVTEVMMVIEHGLWVIEIERAARTDQ